MSETPQPIRHPEHVYLAWTAVGIVAATIAASFWIQPMPLNGRTLYNEYRRWEKSSAAKDLSWEQKQVRYRRMLHADGATPEKAEKILRIITARDEAVLYDPLYANKSPVPQTPTPLLVEALRHHTPGDALDAGMGQGRNAIYLAAKGWRVTGFDVSAAGIRAAEREAARKRLHITTLQSSAEEFEFQRARWDLIAILYPIEKHTIHQVRDALRPGGLVVLECGLRTGAGAPFEYEPGELKKLLAGFEFLHYEEAEAFHEWTGKRQPMVRMIARKRN